ncbi:superoxide dismutase [Dactylosporangium sp. NPDC050688]|uniref:SMP-30/gluconolactonase/LRE family protein n=1 Tax=Dactylosporangium sp. NPDC050688 TaxID=3157217 RepID=UPI0033E4928B
MSKYLRVTAILTVALATALVSAPAHASNVSQATPLPATLSLPDGFQPEGIATGPGPFAYFGSRADGRIYRADLITGKGAVISPAVGTQSLGMKTDQRGWLFVAGGNAGNARVIDVRTGAVLRSYQFATAPTFVNDVVLTPRAAYFTDSNKAVIYKVPIGRHGELSATFQTLPLSGDFVLNPNGLNFNGITLTPDGRALIAVQSSTGFLFRVDPATGVTDRIGDLVFVNGDGLLTVDRTLYVVQNRDNTLNAVKLAKDGRDGTLRGTVTDPRFDVPTTVAKFGNRLYLPNARFTTPPTPTTPYTVVAVRV